MSVLNFLQSRPCNIYLQIFLHGKLLKGLKMDPRTWKTKLVVMALTAISGASASAMTVFTLNVTQTAGLGSGPFGTVTLTQDGLNAVDVSVALTKGFRFLETGGPHDAFTFNLPTLTGYTVTGITATQDLTAPVHTAHPYVWKQPGTNPAYGGYTDRLECSTCGNGGSKAFANALSFKVNLTGLTESSFKPNAAGYAFSADLWRASNGETGAVASVPEPETYAMMLAGLAALGFIGRRRTKA